MGQFTEGKRPSPTAIKEAVAFLDGLGLSVYGPNVDLVDGEVMYGCRDYDAEDIIKLRKFTELHGSWIHEYKELEDGYN